MTDLTPEQVADGDDLMVCRGEHENYEPCQWQRYIPASAAQLTMTDAAMRLYTHSCHMALPIARDAGFDAYRESPWFKLGTAIQDAMPEAIAPLLADIGVKAHD